MFASESTRATVPQQEWTWDDPLTGVSKPRARWVREPALRWAIAGLAAVVLTVAPVTIAHAEEALPREAGYVSLMAGPRLLPHSSFRSRMTRAGVPVRHSLVQPGLLIGFGYKIDESWVVAIEAGGGLDSVRLEQGRRLDLITLSAQITGQYVLPIGPDWFEPYLHAGVGYWLTTISEVAGKRTDAEGVTHGLSAGAGVRMSVGKGFGLVVDSRWIWSRQPTLERGPITVGGGLTTVGLQYVVRGGDDS